jgi:S1-C subfamily serine protease
MALPVSRRERMTMDETASNPEPLVTSAAYLKAAMDDLPKSADPRNVPLSEDEESRLAWLGMELQPLDQDLARENKVSNLTRDGQTGAMVSHVYPDSPASKTGIEPGWILLRILVEDHPKPLEVRLGRDNMEEGPFPWDDLDEVSEQFYERIPTPWPAADNSFTRALTDLGFGTKFTAEFFHDGKTIAKDFAVAPSPATYESAPRYKSAALGLTVRDLTYEVRRYFQKTPDEPGTIVSKVEPGSKASVSGIKPYEIITHVNDKPVKNVKDFEAATQAQDELRLAVKRMNRGRVVKIVMTGAAPAKEAAPEKPAAK